MLGGTHAIGRKQALSVFDPMTRTIIRPELTIRAESVFSVVDSAVFGSTGWAPAHRDTVRAWRIEGAPHGLTAWVDAEGRLVAAKAGVSPRRGPPSKSHSRIQKPNDRTEESHQEIRLVHSR